ncbi:molybdopterin molybdenumtransferase MoeA [bacterium]|nr:molybdopterin molybdenumtransferase MoeA [bacterium]
MIELSAALDTVCRTVAPFPAEPCSLESCLGLTLANEIISDIDSPPFDKALMDGYAVVAADVATGTATLNVIERITAGQVPTQVVTSGTAIQIMTGAPLPQGADAVVRIEDTKLDGVVVQIVGKPVAAEASVIRRGTSLKVGETVLAAEVRLTPSRIGALAELGQAQVAVRRAPRIAVLATGDELVPIDQVPGPGQIRNTNEAMLCAQIRTAGAVQVPLGIARDNREDLAAKIQQGLQADILVLSGGVSAGKLDLVPSELSAAGVREVFHKVNMKPGKPVWFGTFTPPETGRTVAVFGLPGNPVSSMVCFELFVRTAVRRLMGSEPARPAAISATVLNVFRHRSDRPTYHPAEITWTATGPQVRLLPWQGSSDLRATVSANGMAVLPAEEQLFQPGDRVDVVSWDA